NKDRIGRTNNLGTKSRSVLHLSNITIRVERSSPLFLRIHRERNGKKKEESESEASKAAIDWLRIEDEGEPEYMGASGSFLDDLLSWFQRHHFTISSSSSNNTTQISNNNNDIVIVDEHHHHSTPALTLTLTQKQPPPQQQFVVQDLDYSSLDLIKVPNLLINSMEKKGAAENDFFTEYGEGSQYQIQEIIGKGSYGVVASAVDTHTGEKVAIKKINDVFEHVSDATRILREIKLLRLLRHPDIVEIKHIMLPPSRREFRDIYVVFELMESDLHQVIKANDDLTPEHHQFFLYQLLRSLKYIHSANVFHRDLKPKNILANADCKLKICDFGLARVSFNDAPSAIFWTYTPAIDIWSIGCIFAEILTGKPLFPGKNVVHQLDLMTDTLGTPPPESISRIRNEKARRYLSSMRKKQPIPFSQKFPNVDHLALRLLERLLAFDPKDRPTAEEALADPYFYGLANVDREPSTQAISKLEFEFERRKLTKDDVRELIYRELSQLLATDIGVSSPDAAGVSSRWGSDQLYVPKRQFAHLEEHYGKGGEKSTPLLRHHASLPRERVPVPKDENADQDIDGENSTSISQVDGSIANAEGQNGSNKPNSARSLVKSASISASKCVGVQAKDNSEDNPDEATDETADVLSQKVANLNA
ncbi:hypothetical protein Gotri_017453, partial [Gossypium trilobum]|nr:hypothetical protein [Gossypium trilobum]